MEREGKEQRTTNEQAQNNSETDRALDWKSETLLATSDICTIRRPLCKTPEFPPTSRSSRGQSAQVSGPTIFQLTLGELNVLSQGLGLSEGSVVHYPGARSL